MRISTLIEIMTIGAIAAIATPAHARSAAGRWQGVLLRDGLQVPISMELDGKNQDLSGRFHVEDTFIPIQDGRETMAGIHFAVPGAGVFDGTVANDSMAGSVSGSAAAGSFSVTRERDSVFGDAITSSGP